MAAADEPILTTLGLLFEANAGLERRLSRRMQDECGISVQWFEVLLRLARSPGHRLRMSDLAAQTTLTPSGLTRAVDRLEEAGLVARQACPSDRRGWHAVLTESGRQQVEDAVPSHLRHVAEILDGTLSDVEVAQLTDLLRKVRDAANPEAAAASRASPA